MVDVVLIAVAGGLVEPDSRVKRAPIFGRIAYPVRALVREARIGGYAAVAHDCGLGHATYALA